MFHSLSVPGRIVAAATGLLLTCPIGANASAQAACGLCNTSVVMNSDLATCFLSEYEKLAAKEGLAIVVDLSACDVGSRGIAEALPSPITPSSPTGIEPDLTFMVSRPQLDCLKQKLEAPGIVLDPYAKIELNSCG